MHCALGSDQASAATHFPSSWLFLVCLCMLLPCAALCIFKHHLPTLTVSGLSVCVHTCAVCPEASCSSYALQHAY